ncbi:hypothetical protein GCM10011519_01290 [Marmoricola endophyticus]|uniref:Transcription regulator PadR N-terminal domain-containing protein n=1 Tax=Marmoricola endophyticus TaxID=2040280 RepID=A0A917B9B6_9ACTN|nr:PadR family transcriptional regulator [Marmoricola endophyticus]GGF31691.1 hypothetical protein GCM10011519_01290 [Marmoricola endophyticus]
MGRHHHFTREQVEDLRRGFDTAVHDTPDLAGPRRGDRRARGGFGGPPWAGFGGPGGFPGGFPGFGGRGPGGPGAGRRRRGDVRAAILDVLASQDAAQESLNGYQVIQAIAERTDEAWKPSPGSVYPTVQQLEDEGLVRTEESGGRKVLLLTDEGRTYVSEHADELAAVWAPFAEGDTEGSGRKDLKKAVGETMAAVWQVAATGSPAQVEQAVEILADTRKRIYTILAEGDPR